MTHPTFSQHEVVVRQMSISAPNHSSPSSTAEVIVNPVTGDRMTILQSAQHHQGAYAQIQFDLPPGATGSPLHYHTRMDETFTVLKGTLDMEIGQKGQWYRLQAGDRVWVPAGVHHSFCNRTEEWVTLVTENRPGDGFEKFIRGLYGLAIDGRVTATGLPLNPLQFAILLRQADTVPVGVPPLLFHGLIHVLSGIAHSLNVERSLHPYWLPCSPSNPSVRVQEDAIGDQ